MSLPVKLTDEGHNVRATTIKRFPYIVYYRLHTDQVEGLAILHGSRDASEWQRRVLMR